METLILLTKSASILGLFYVIYLTVLYKNTLFTAKRHYFIAGIIAAITLPFIEFTREIEVIIPSQPLVMTSLDISSVKTAPIAVTSQPVEQAVNWWQVLFIIYIIGICIMLCRLCAQYISLRQLIASGSRSTKGRYTFVAVTKAISPFSFFSKIVYNPAFHTPEELEMIIAHEKVHAQQRHSLDMLLSQITLVIQWCNPFAWMYKNSLEQNLEYLADHQAIQEIKNPKQYQRTLVQVSSPSFAPALTNQFYQSFIKKRIVMINTPQSHKNNLWRLSLIIPVLALFMYSFNVKEVTNYVEEDNIAFAKAETPSIKPVRNNEFTITRNSTALDLDNIEKEVAERFPQSLIRFSNRRIAENGIIKRFDFQTKFAGDRVFHTRFKRAKDISKTWEGYQISFNEKGINVIENGEKGTSFRIDVDKLEFLNLLGTVYDRALIKNGDSYEEENKGNYPRASYNPPVVVKDTTLLSQSPKIQIKDTLRAPKVLNSQETYSYIITKNTTDNEIDALIKVMKDKHNATLKVSGIKRNRNLEIEKISVNLKDDNGNNKNYTLKSSNPINDIYIYRNADGSTGMGNVNMENDQRKAYDNRRASLEKRRKSMINSRDSMRTNMEARKQDMRARMEERRSLQGRAQVDSMRQDMLSRRDSMKMQMKERRENLKSDRENYKNSRQQRDMRYVTLDEETYYSVVSPEGSKSFYNRWGKQIKEDTPLYQKLLDEASSTVSSLSQNKLMEQLPEEDILKSDSSDKPIIYINGKLHTSGQMKNLNPNDIESISIVKEEKAIELYGQAGKNGVILVKTKD
ncbi:M56 family metallopeptidase [Dokdonia sp. PRO95]|uniref:M56 family metallopeptidase n=1 Tax=Dokdonia sp. PRO95 TaxID=1239415 RepID=UPI00054CDE30|nr:M56 family metallopeptidase [Dokdonia sp. PRO95]